jgi:tRNA U34 5-methylaminomethyl-2-thiouridine-forming methyltransferase MnmC
LQTTLQDWQVEENAFDVIYYDAFAPSKQPELWELPLLQKAVRSLREGGIFVTYCAKGQVKRDLKTLRLKVETRPGPPGKKEMTLAFKTELSSL